MTDRPIRIQLSRAKGWRMPPNTVKVDRSTRWGNPFRVGDSVICDEGTVAVCFSATEAVQAYRIVVDHPIGFAFRVAARSHLRGKNLACWCPIGSPCHADVLLEIANA